MKTIYQKIAEQIKKDGTRSLEIHLQAMDESARIVFTALMEVLEEKFESVDWDTGHKEPRQ